MKLLDLLVQELPKHGGWPEGCHYISQYKHGELCYHKANKYCLKAVTGVCLEPHEEGDETGWAYGVYVSREQYEAALNKSVWNGEGLPPVGCECEFFDCEQWFKVTMMYGGSQLVVLFDHKNQVERTFSTSRIDGKFRPIRTEVDEMVELSGISVGAAKILYDAGYRKG